MYHRLNHEKNSEGNFRRILFTSFPGNLYNIVGNFATLEGSCGVLAERGSSPGQVELTKNRRRWGLQM